MGKIIIIDKTKLDALPPSQAELREKSDVDLVPGHILRRNKCLPCGHFYFDVQDGVLCPKCKQRALPDYHMHKETRNGNLPTTVDRIMGVGKTKRRKVKRKASKSTTKEE